MAVTEDAFSSAFVVACIRHRALASSITVGVCCRMRSSSHVASISCCVAWVRHRAAAAPFAVGVCCRMRSSSFFGHHFLSAFVLACLRPRASAPSFAVSVCCCIMTCYLRLLSHAFVIVRGLHHLLSAFVLACVRDRASAPFLTIGVRCHMRSSSRVGFIINCRRLLSHAVVIARRLHHLL